MTVAAKGSQVSVHYRGTLTDGTEFDNSYSRNTPITFQLGSGQMIAGFDSAVVGMTIGETKTITISPEDAYGAPDPERKTELSRDLFPTELELEEGMPVPLGTPDGRHLVGKITQLSEQTVTVDLNHPLAGEELSFDIELVEIEE